MDTIAVTLHLSMSRAPIPGFLDYSNDVKRKLSLGLLHWPKRDTAGVLTLQHLLLAAVQGKPFFKPVSQHCQVSMELLLTVVLYLHGHHASPEQSCWVCSVVGGEGQPCPSGAINK